jgi:hypothetical protein
MTENPSTSIPNCAALRVLKLGLPSTDEHRGRHSYPIPANLSLNYGCHLSFSYLARYLKGGPISQGRLPDCRHGHVRFGYRDNQDRDAEGRGKRKTTGLPVALRLPVDIALPERLSDPLPPSAARFPPASPPPSVLRPGRRGRSGARGGPDEPPAGFPSFSRGRTNLPGARPNANGPRPVQPVVEADHVLIFRCGCFSGPGKVV